MDLIEELNKIREVYEEEEIVNALYSSYVIGATVEMIDKDGKLLSDIIDKVNIPNDISVIKTPTLDKKIMMDYINENINNLTLEDIETIIKEKNNGA